MPQIFLRDLGRKERNEKIIELRFIQHLEGDYTNLLTEWRAAIAKNERQRKPPKNDDAHRRVKSASSFSATGTSDAASGSSKATARPTLTTQASSLR